MNQQKDYTALTNRLATSAKVTKQNLYTIIAPILVYIIDRVTLSLEMS